MDSRYPYNFGILPGVLAFNPGTPPITLGTLTLSGTLTTGVATSGTIIGATAGSTISASIPGITINSGARTYSGTPTAAGSYDLTETLAGATNTPHASPVTVASAGAVTGDPLSFAVTGNTILEPDGNGNGAFINGWTATIVYKGLSANANVNAFDGQKVTLTVTDPGYLSDGTTTTVTRTIKGSITVRRPWPNNGSRQISAVGSDLQLIVALEDIIYQGSTITQVVFASGSYPGANALTLTGASVTNNSTRPYPKPFFAWLNRQFERATGSSFPVECVFYHRHGMNGQMIACAEFTGKDPAGHSAAVQRCSAPTLSSIQTRGNIVEAWKASVPLSALDQATTTAAGNCKVHVRAYPWIGDSSAILDTEVDGLAWPTPLPLVSLQFCNDKNGTYGGAFAYVQQGASGGAVSSNAVTARTTPFPTITAAYSACATWNNTNKGHNDHSGSTIRLMDDGAGGAVTHLLSANANPTAGLCWSTIEADPLATGAIRFQLSVAQASFASLTAIGTGVTVYNNGSTTIGGAWAIGTASGNLLSLDGCVMDMSVAGSSTGAQNYTRSGYMWFRNVDWKDPQNSTKLITTASLQQFVNLMLGNTAVGNISFTEEYCTIGNAVVDCKLDGDIGGTSRMVPDGKIYANNSVMKLTNSTINFGNNCLAGSTYSRGQVVVQNLVECLNIVQTQITFTASAESGPLAIPEMLEMHNTVLGNRGNWLYDDAVSKNGKEKRGISKYSLWYSKPKKGDTFAQSSGATANWEWLYSVGSYGSKFLCGGATQSGTAVQGVVDPSLGPNNCISGDATWGGMYWPPTCFYGNSANGDYSLVHFVDDKCGMLGNGVGGGDYHLTGATNICYDVVPAGKGILKYDLGGTVRLNDGTGAAGPFERT